MSDLKERILQCAVDLYLDQGLKGLSMRHLAEMLDVSATALYRHYRNKEDLVHSIIGEAAKVFGNYLFAALAGKTAKERFDLAATAYLNFALEHSKYYEVIFMGPQQLGAECLPEELQDKSRATFQFLVDRVQECMEAGCLRKDEPFGVAMTIWAHSHGLIAIFLAGKWPIEEPNFRILFGESQKRLMHGLEDPKLRS